MEIENEILGMVRNIGRAAANVMFPNDVEYYAISIELSDSMGDTIDYLTFPINPDSFSYDDSSLTTIRATMGGVTSLTTPTFNPKAITMSGSFGRSFKLLLSPPIKDPETDGGLNLSREDGLQLNTEHFSAKLKSGYGAIKLLEKILVRSKDVDKYGQPFKLFLYTPLIGHSFLVEYRNFQLKQEVGSSNMLWKYSVQLDAISKLNQSNAKSLLSSVAENVATSVMQKGAGALLGVIRGIL